jgi:hypothetical protein
MGDLDLGALESVLDLCQECVAYLHAVIERQ